MKRGPDYEKTGTVGPSVCDREMHGDEVAEKYGVNCKTAHQWLR